MVCLVHVGDHHRSDHDTSELESSEWSRDPDVRTYTRTYRDINHVVIGSELEQEVTMFSRYTYPGIAVLGIYCQAPC